ncbi:MAG TPA: peptide deformylase [Armatimonadetes bacterium]|nr:peptide deformylase [Armatimonadota bacterium]
MVEIVEYGDPILRKKAKKVRRITKEHKRLADLMVEVIREAPALGVSAPQLGVSERVIAASTDEKEIYIVVNPRIVVMEGEEVGVEGCLSLPGLQGEVKRAGRVVVKGLDISGEPVEIEAEGLLARVFQHEVDHLEGVLFIDRVLPGTLEWVIEDESAEGGYRTEPTTLEEALSYFERKARLRRGRL